MIRFTYMLIAFIIGIGIAATAYSHGTTVQYDSWFDKDGNSCCNQMDCRPTDERIGKEGYEAKIGNDWIPVPADRILKQRSPDGRPHLCYNPSKGVLCFQPGMST